MLSFGSDEAVNLASFIAQYVGPNATQDPCSATEFTCSGGSVTQVTGSYSGFTGTIPAAIASLSRLQYL